MVEDRVAVPPEIEKAKLVLIQFEIPFDTVKKIGFEKTEKYEDANCYLLNTCHIRDKAKEKVYHEIGRVKKIFREKKKPIVIVAGCVAQAENQEMLKREPYIDIVIGPQSYHCLLYTSDAADE